MTRSVRKILTDVFGRLPDGIRLLLSCVPEFVVKLVHATDEHDRGRGGPCMDAKAGCLADGSVFVNLAHVNPEEDGPFLRAVFAKELAVVAVEIVHTFMTYGVEGAAVIYPGLSRLHTSRVGEEGMSGVGAIMDILRFAPDGIHIDSCAEIALEDWGNFSRELREVCVRTA